MLRLQMNSQMAKIGLNIKKHDFTMDTKNPKLNLEINKPEIEIETTKPKVNIDQTEAFADAGIKNTERQMRDMASEAVRVMLKGIERNVSQGDQLADIHKVSDDTVIANQAYHNAFGQFEYDWALDFIPKHGPEFTPIKGEVNIRLKKGTVNGQLDRGDVQTKFNRGKVETYLRQKNKLDIKVFEGKKFDLEV